MLGVIHTWSVEPDIGRINSNGFLVTGTRAGEFPDAVQVAVVQGEAKLTAAADLSVRPDPLFSVEIEPSFAVLRLGATQRFTATGLDFFGNPVPDMEFAWEAPGGVIEQIDARTADFHGGAQGSRYEVKASAQFRNNTRTGVALVGIPPGWMPAGNMAAPRRDHAAVLLDDGTVLIVGGTSTTAELYNPATRTFTLLGSVPFRQGLGATRLADGRVLVVGERGTDPGRTVMIYDPATRQFTPTGGLNVARGYSSVTLLPDGEVLVAGGQERAPDGNNQTVDVAEVYDPATGDFTVIGSLNEHRSGHAAVLLPSGKVLILGGTQTTRPGYGFSLDIVELYDPALRDFSVIGKTASFRVTGSILLKDGKVLLLGDRPEIFDPATNSFSPTEDMITRHGANTTTLLPDGTVMVAGGIHDRGVELYDPVTRSWSKTFELPEPRQAHSATLLPTGEVLIIGGSVLSEDRRGSEDRSSALIHVP